MITVPLTDDLFEGAIEIEHGEGYVKPWRLPFATRRLFPSPDDLLLARAENASGPRLRFATNATRLEIELGELSPVNPVCKRDTHHVDVTLDGELLASAPVKTGVDTAIVDGLPEGTKTLEVWLPQDSPAAIRRLAINDGGHLEAVADPRLKWVTYGSSLTHCVRAHSPARTWPAIVARRHGLNLTNLGFGGQCHLDPMIGMLIRDLPADYITLKLGINTISGSLNARTFPAAVMGLVKIIREKHPETPIILISPIGYPPHETTPNRVDYTISQMREAIEDVWQRLVDAGDRHLGCVNGLDVFNLDLIAEHTEDQCHPSADGIELMADNFDRAVMSKLLVM